MVFDIPAFMFLRFRYFILGTILSSSFYSSLCILYFGSDDDITRGLYLAMDG